MRAKHVRATRPMDTPPRAVHYEATRADGLATPRAGGRRYNAEGGGLEVGMARAAPSLAIPALIGEAYACYRPRFALLLADTVVAQAPPALFGVLVGYGASVLLDRISAGGLPRIESLDEVVG